MRNRVRVRKFEFRKKRTYRFLVPRGTYRGSPGRPKYHRTMPVLTQLLFAICIEPMLANCVNTVSVSFFENFKISKIPKFNFEFKWIFANYLSKYRELGWFDVLYIYHVIRTVISPISKVWNTFFVRLIVNFVRSRNTYMISTFLRRRLHFHYQLKI